MKNNNGFTTLEAFIFTIVIALFTFWFAFLVYIIPSAFISGIKRLSGDCNSTYSIERVWKGDWFCPISSKGK